MILQWDKYIFMNYYAIFFVNYEIKKYQCELHDWYYNILNILSLI